MMEDAVALFIDNDVRVVKGQTCWMCGKAAWYWHRHMMPRIGRVMMTSMAFVVNTAKIKPALGEAFSCQWCGQSQPKEQACNPKNVGDFNYETGEKIKEDQRCQE